MPIWLLILSTCVVAAALTMTLVNLGLFRRSPREHRREDALRTVSVCIPARNESANIEACVRSVLSSSHPRLLVLIYDDQSTDDTPRIIDSLALDDWRVHRVPTHPLPDGWVGKQWACEQLGRAATSDDLLFIDADVRLLPDCIPQALAHARELNAAMLSTFPRQLTGTMSEKLLVPLIHFILLSYLPFARMRTSRDPSASAACGQFVLVRRDAYLASGGHAAVRDSMHDGVKLPRAFRRAGFHTDLFDGTAVCECRMYRGLAQTWRGFTKNAYEGLGSLALLLLLSVLHAVGHIIPFVTIGIMLARSEWAVPQWALAVAAASGAIVHRLILAARFRQSVLGALLHPVGITFMLVVQWYSYALHLCGRRGWRGRSLTPASGATPDSAPIDSPHPHPSPAR